MYVCTYVCVYDGLDWYVPRLCTCVHRVQACMYVLGRLAKGGRCQGGVSTHVEYLRTYVHTFRWYTYCIRQLHMYIFVCNPFPYTSIHPSIHTEIFLSQDLCTYTHLPTPNPSTRSPDHTQAKLHTHTVCMHLYYQRACTASIRKVCMYLVSRPSCNTQLAYCAGLEAKHTCVYEPSRTWAETGGYIHTYSRYMYVCTYVCIRERAVLPFSSKGVSNAHIHTYIHT